MGSRWRKAKNVFRLRVCTSVPLEPDEEQQPPFVSLTPTSDVVESAPTSIPNLRLCVNVGRRTDNSSNPSTSRIEYQKSVSSPNLRCKAASGGFPNPSSAATRTKASSRSTPSSLFSPRLQCMINNSPRMTDISAPSSPRSPSRFSLLMSSLRLTRSLCGICKHSTKSGKWTAVFTAECSHSFHFSCISSHVQKQGSLSCPICQVKWKELPMLPGAPLPNHQKQYEVVRVYDDDEPLLRGSRFNPIPEVQEEEDDEEKDNEVEFKGFPVTEKMGFDEKREREVAVTAAPETALVGAGRGYESYAVVLRVARSRQRDPAPRAAIDLVTVLDVSVSMSGMKLSMMKRSMLQLISSLGSSDRLSIVAFSSVSKRLLPLRRMTAQGQRAARRLVERLVCSQGTCVPEALRKAAKVLEDRRERNPVVSIMLLSDGQNESSASSPVSGTTGISLPAKTMMMTTRFEHVEIPILYFSFSGSSSGAIEDKFSKCVGQLLSVVVQDVYMKIQPSGCEIGGAYSWHDRPRLLLQQTGCRTGSVVVRLGDLYAEEGREILIEVRIPAGAGAIPGNQAFTVHCCFRDPVTQRLVCGREQVLALPSTRPTRAASHTVERLRSRFQTTRAAAQAAHLAELGDFRSAQQILAAACSVLSKSSSSDKQRLQGSLESELAQVQWRWRHCHQKQQHPRQAEAALLEHEDSVEALTPTSAWRAAERLAKVAIMRKSMNRVSDLHGFEDARF